MSTTVKVLIGLIILAILDALIPVPLTTLTLIYVVLRRPDWFTKLMETVYAGE